jgi:hypothetical protein
VTLDHFIVADTRAPWAPRALCERLVGRLRPHLSAPERQARAGQVRQRLVEANARYYARLRDLASHARAPMGDDAAGRDTALTACKRLADHQLDLLGAVRSPGARQDDPGQARVTSLEAPVQDTGGPMNRDGREP